MWTSTFQQHLFQGSNRKSQGFDKGARRYMYLLLAVRSHWKPEGWWAKRSRGHLAFRIFWMPTHPGANRSRLSPMTDSILWVTTRSDETRFSWNSIDKPDFGCKCKEGRWSLFNLDCQTQKWIKNVPLFLHLKKNCYSMGWNKLMDLKDYFHF